jgi:hypothetical protein
MKRGLLTVLFTSALVAALAVVTPSFAQDNMLVNPGFENGYAGWFTFGSGVQLSTPSTDSIARTDTVASKIFGEFTMCPTPRFDVGGYVQIFAPTEEKAYQFSGYSYMSSTDPIPGSDVCTGNRAIAKIVFFDAPSFGNEISSNEIIIGDYSTPQDEWHPFTVVSAPTPPGAVRVEALILFLQPGCDTGSVFIDDLDLREITPVVEWGNVLVNPSFTSGMDGWTTFGNVYGDLREWAIRTVPGSAKMFGTFEAGFNSGMFQSFRAAPDSEWRLELYSMITCLESPISGTNDNFATAQILFTNSNGDSIGAVDAVIADNTSPLGTWTKHTLMGTAPAGTAGAEAFIVFIQPTNPALSGAVWVDDVSFQQSSATGIEDETPNVSRIQADNYPNPFNPTTTIRFVLPEATHGTLEIYDVSVALVTTLLDESRAGGVNTATWNATNASGRSVSTGVYYYRLRTSREVLTRRMMLLK